MFKTFATEDTGLHRGTPQRTGTERHKRGDSEPGLCFGRYSRMAEGCVTLIQVQTTTAETRKKIDNADDQSRPDSFRRSIWFIVLIAFLLRILVIIVGHTYRVNPLRDHFNFGWEMGRIARS